ncbi:neprilysin-1-like [Dermacentor silvarum]|uniref:neprilysin-1-like n=1 Tax=Dermacentor silvarum TaxID=543639 RepID=UPI0021012A9D|nr:neprilysin-1-like [Dermacentor silvarum]
MQLTTAVVYLLVATFSPINPYSLSLAAAKEKVKNYTVCKTDVCKERARLLNKSINTSIDPCDDFFGFVCDGWIKDHPIPQTDASFGTFQQTEKNVLHDLRGIIENITDFAEPRNVTEMAATVYRACICNYFTEEELIPMVKHVIARMGFPKWPAMRPSEVPYTNYTHLLMTTSLWPFFFVNVAQDLNDTNRFIIELDEMPYPILGRDQLLYPSTEYNKPIVQAYLHLIATAVKVLNPNATAYDATIVAERIFVFEARLASMTTHPNLRRDIKAIYQKITIEELQKEVPNIPVLQSLNRVFSVANITLNNTEQVAMFGMSYFKKANDFFGCIYDLSDMYNLAAWRRIFQLVLLTSKAFAKSWQQLLEIASGVQKQKPDWQLCLERVAGVMPFVIGRMYIDKNFNVTAKTDVETMIKNITTTFNKSLSSREWLNGSTKQTALDKLEKMTYKIGFPLWILNDTVMENRFPYVRRFNISDPLFKIILSFQDNAAIKTLLLLRMKPDKKNSWITAPAVVNAFYNPPTNEMVFPAGILRDSFYQHGLPASINYGAIGTIIGHEMIHGFDNTGKQFDEDGRLRNWWSNSTQKKFDVKAKCFIDQYSSVFSELANRTLNGVNTLGENMADNGGLRMAFRTLDQQLKAFDTPDVRLPGLEKYSAKHLFFISAAYVSFPVSPLVWCGSSRPEALRLQIEYDPHSPRRQRINVSLKNMKSFTSVFHCNETKKMSFKAKSNETCVLW